MSNLVITKALTKEENKSGEGGYQNKQAHHELAERMKKRTDADRRKQPYYPSYLTK